MYTKQSSSQSCCTTSKEEMRFIYKICIYLHTDNLYSFEKWCKKYCLVPALIMFKQDSLNKMVIQPTLDDYKFCLDGLKE